MTIDGRESSRKRVRLEELDSTQQSLLSFLLILFSFSDGDETSQTAQFLSRLTGLSHDALLEMRREILGGSSAGQVLSSRNAIRYDISGLDELDVRKIEAARPLLDLIADAESEGNYNIVYGGRTMPLTEMTIDQVIDWQRQCVNSGSPSSACGRYQIITKTLGGLKDELGLTGNELYDEAMQDRLAIALLERRGMEAYLKGDISTDQFIHKLSQEWAGLPKDMGGRSYYAGDGLNGATVTYRETRAAVEEFREAAREATEAVVARPDTELANDGPENPEATPTFPT